MPNATKTLVVPIATGWAHNAVNTPVFRKNSVVSFQDLQYAAFYDSAGFVVLAKRPRINRQWQVKRTPYTGNVKDAHNSISLMVDGAGYLHLAWDHHNNALRYCRSIAPGSLELTPKLPMLDKNENQVSYPEFYKMPNGDLLFFYRDGASGQGNLVINRYSLPEQKWERVHDVLIDGEGQRNAYWQATIDNQGTIHLSWVWRESPDVASNHDLAYAKSEDGGKTWKKSTGEVYNLPITAANAEYAARIPQKSELINQTSMSTDSEGRPFIASYWRPIGSLVPQYHVVFHNGKQWQTQQISNRQTAFSLSGVGTKKIPISRPQIIADNTTGKGKAYLIFRDTERGSKVSLSTCLDLNKGIWTTQDLTDFSVGSWEPTYDTELWKTNLMLHIFVQDVGQGDGETLENKKPSLVSVLEWQPQKK